MEVGNRVVGLVHHHVSQQTLRDMRDGRSKKVSKTRSIYMSVLLSQRVNRNASIRFVGATSF